MNKPVLTNDDLVRQVRHDPQVLKRYELQFKMGEPELIHYFKRLHVEPLQGSKRYLVFNVDENYVIRHRLLHLGKGALVFSDSSHHPVLKRSCGNPMTTYLPALGKAATALNSAPQAAPRITRSAEAPATLEILTADNDVALTGAAPVSTEETLVADVNDTVPGAPLAAPVLLTQDVGEVVGGPAEGGSGIAPLAFLPIIGIFGDLLSNHSGSGYSAPAIVPEPTAGVPVLIGVLGLALGRKRRR